MICIFSHPLNKDNIASTINMLKERVSSLSCVDLLPSDFIYTSERNTDLLLELIERHEITVLYADLREFGSETDIELLRLNLESIGCTLQSDNH
jgi:hypothetical protein